MTPASGKHACLLALLTLLAGIGSLPIQAEETASQEQVTVKPGINALIKRILEDPNIDFESVRGPDDCSSETLYQGTKSILGEYIATPGEKQAALVDYILSDKETCNCTKSIVGKDFNLLVEDVGLKMSDLPCLQPE